MGGTGAGIPRARNRVHERQGFVARANRGKTAGTASYVKVYRVLCIERAELELDPARDVHQPLCLGFQCALHDREMQQPILLVSLVNNKTRHVMLNHGTECILQ